MQNIIPIIDNILFLMLMGLVLFLVERNRKKLGRTATNILYGFGLGLIGFLVTSNPVSLVDGATVDARAGPMILAGFIGGPVGGLIAASLGGLARGLVGGSFAPSGMLVYFIYALSGMAIRFLGLAKLSQIATPRAILIMTAASLLGASAMFFVITPMERAIQWAKQDLPFIYLANTLSVVFSALIAGLVCRHLQQSAKVIELNETLEFAKRAGKFGVWDYDVRSGVLLWDARSMELHGVDPAAFKGSYEDWVGTVHPDDLERAKQEFQHVLKQNVPYSVEYRVVLPSGRIRAIKGDAIVVRNAAGHAIRVVGTNLDLTELRTAEENLSEARLIAAQAQKFESIGQLTGGVAHDFNNLLAVIMGNQELLKDQLKSGSFDAKDAGQLIDASIVATKRGAELTRNMLAYARKARLDPVVTDMNKIAKETDSWMRRTIESRIEIRTKLLDGLWPTLIDTASLQAALVNLLLNARDAFDGSGQVTIETGNILIGPDQASNGAEYVRPGRYAMLKVSDNGSGMPDDVVDKIFDPFFTTKPVGVGSGLGLSMVHGFVKQSGGAINVRSRIGEGTSIEMYFPAHHETIKGNAEPSIPSVHSEKFGNVSGKRILLVEDQEAVLDVLEKTLRSVGCDVVTATSGDDAFRMFQEDSGFDVVVTDVVMPGELQGPSLARKIRDLRWDTPFVFLSGYASETLVHGNGLRAQDVRLMKPVTRSKLLKAVQDALAGADAATPVGVGAEDA